MPRLKDSIECMVSGSAIPRVDSYIYRLELSSPCQMAGACWQPPVSALRTSSIMETIGGDLRQMQRTPLAPAHVEALRIAGAVARYPAGTLLARPGQPVDRFVYVEEGEIEVVNPYTDERHLPSTIGPTQFMSEISLL